MSKLKHVKQSNDHTCTLACIAMVSNIPMEKIIEVAVSVLDVDPLEVGMNSHDTDFLLRKLHIDYEYIYPSRLSFGEVYIVSTPSLNREAIMHSVVIDLHEVFTVLDPQKGRPGKKYYSENEEETELSRNIRGYANVLRIK